LKPVTVQVPDLDKTLSFSIAEADIRETTNTDPDLIVRSQPLHFAFSFPFGIQTLGVSARYALVKDFPNWRRHRVLFSMNNAELYLRPKFLFTPKNLSFFWNRLPGALNQFVYRLKVMR
jgi:UDP-MurNAc hydroxylase